MSGGYSGKDAANDQVPPAAGSSVHPASSQPFTFDSSGYSLPQYDIVTANSLSGLHSQILQLGHKRQRLITVIFVEPLHLWQIFVENL